MKKLSSLVPVLMLLSACTSYQPDIEEAAEVRIQNRNEIRAELGCQFADDHATYRDCLIATYKKQRPRTFSVTTSCDGQPVAVVSNGELKPTNPAIMHAAGIETSTVVTTVPVQAPDAQQPTPVQQVQEGCISLPGQPCVYQQQGEVYEMQIPATPCGQEECPPLIEGPKTVTVTTTETVTEKPVEVVPMPEPLPEKTWWETYQETKEPPKVVCPCPDPNDPCPQCNSK